MKRAMKVMNSTYKAEKRSWRHALIGAVMGTVLLVGTVLTGGPLAPITGTGIAYAQEGDTAQGASTTEMAASAGEMIRVALFANLGSRSPGHAKQVTLSSPEGLTFKARAANGQVNLGNEQARFSLDSYQVKVFESKDRAAAQAVLKRVQATNSAYMLQFTRRGATFYAVYAGEYSTQSQAAEQLKKLQNDSTLSNLLKGYQPQVVGPNYLQAGIYSSIDEAKKVQKLLLDADFDAYVVSMVSSGKHVTSVWVGQASSASELEALKGSISSKAGSVSVSSVQSTGAIIHTLEDTGSGTIPRYKVYGDQKWAVQSSSTIKVKERYDRTYRGMMEVGAHNGELSLVNELPLEQYLVSVVGGEVYTSWPLEALKAQAVAARTFALYQNGKFEIANVVDTTLSQAYYGVEKEHPRVKEAVEATEGMVLMQDGKLIESIFNSNAGGITADPSEVWGGSYGWFQVVESPDDVVQAGKKNWYYVALPSGKVGYVREDVVTKAAKKNGAGFEIAYAVEEDTNIRPIPAVQSTVAPVEKVSKQTPLTILATVPESTEYSWVRGPYTGEEIAQMLKKTKTDFSGPAYKLEVTERGPSGRVTKMEVNGVNIEVSSPDSFRGAFGGLPSTLFEVESSSSYTVVGAGGKKVDMNGIGGKAAVSASASGSQALKDGTVVLNGNGEARVLTSQPSFVFKGKGYGHGVGLSQWGAKGLADQGYDYEQILKYYYKDVELVKR
ncbi:SpoIID/LytB domain-containing protein [Paenibacillus marinisediminis]